MSEDTTTLDMGDRGAVLSNDGRYRYSLWRTWDADRPSALFIMLNPSTADADVDDPTIRKCIGFARRWDLGGIHVCNLYPWRATDPRELPRGRAVMGENDGLRNTYAIIDAAENAARIIAAWGANTGPHPGRGRLVLNLIGDLGVEALRLTKHGHPWHPLYVPYSATPVVLSPKVEHGE